MAQGKSKEADEAREWLGQSQGNDESPVKITKEELKTNERSIFEKLSSLKEPANLRPLVLCFFLCSAYQLSGIAPLTFFKVQFLQDAGASLDPYVASIILALINLVTTIIVGVTFSNPSRRLMVLISQAGVTICLFIISTYFLLKDLNQVDEIRWLPLVAMIGLFIFFNIGISSFLWFVIAEILPVAIRSFVYPAIMFEGSVNFFLATSSFKTLFLNLGGFGLFLFYA